MVQQQTMNPMATATTPWSTATAHLSHCKAWTETFDSICHMTMFQEELEIPWHQQQRHGQQQPHTYPIVKLRLRHLF